MPTNDPYCRIQERGWEGEGRERKTLPDPGRWQAEGLTEGAIGQRGVAGMAPSTAFGGPPPRDGEDLDGDQSVFTPALKLRFLDALAQHGNVRVACAAVGVSRSGIYLVRRRDAAFAAGWIAALREARYHAEAVLAERALDGVEEQVFYHGEVVATRRRFDTRLLLAHLARLDALCAAAAEDEPFDQALARAAGLAEQAPLSDRAALISQAVELAAKRFDHTVTPPCEDELRAALQSEAELDALDDDFEGEAEDETDLEERLDAAYQAAEAGYCAARDAAMSAARAAAAEQWDGAQAGLLGAVDALRAGSAFEVKSLHRAACAPEFAAFARTAAPSCALGRRADPVSRFHGATAFSPSRTLSIVSTRAACRPCRPSLMQELVGTLTEPEGAGHGVTTTGARANKGMSAQEIDPMVRKSSPFSPAFAALFAAALTACSQGQAAAPPPAPAGHGVQVVELFQSQGCSSCPPANANVMALADRPGVLTLSWQVTYWDYLGWKDSFAQAAFTARQHAYAGALGHDGVFTPQVVVNGRGDLVGAGRGEVEQALRRFDRGGDAVRVTLGAGQVTVAGSSPASSVYLVRYDPRIVRIPIKAGENGGRTLPHRNVVREFALLGKFSGGTHQFALPASKQTGLKTAVLVQTGVAGLIVAAVHS